MKLLDTGVFDDDRYFDVFVYSFYGPDFKVECPTGSGKYMKLFEVAKRNCQSAGENLSSRQQRQASCIWRRSFRRTRTGRITSSSTSNFHGNNGAGLGASHETGWTGAIARVLDLFARITPEATLEGAQKYMAVTREQVAGVQLAKWLERGLTSAVQTQRPGFCHVSRERVRF
jgi:hypothetical protein